MNQQFIEAREYINKAREALRQGDKASAWKLGEQAAQLAPDLEDVWLILTAAEPDPQEALAYAQKALEINPSSPRARKAVDWAQAQVDQIHTLLQNAPAEHRYAEALPLARLAPVVVEQQAQPQPKSRNRTFLFAAAFLGVLMCVVLAFAAYSAVTHPAFASILNRAPVPTKADHWSPMDIAKPSVTPIDASAFAQGEPTATALATEVPATVTKKAARPTATEVATEAPTDEPAITPTPQATETPGTMAMEIVEDTPTPEAPAPPAPGELPDIAKSGDGVRWIDVDLTNQAVYAYEGDVMVNSFIVSTGTWLTPTVTGQYKIYVKYRYADMHGPGYFLPDVPYVMYFYKGYGLHGTYWHNNFGHPMSHGCINLRTDEAGWLFEWASVGTVVNVHY